MPFGSDNSANRSWAFDPASASAFRTGFNSYRVQQFPVDGSASSMVWEPVSPTTAGIESVAVTGGEVYWSVGGNPAVVLKKAIGADPTTNPTQAFFPRYRASYLRVQGNAFYWVSGDYQDPSPTPRFGYVYTRAISAASNDPGTAIVTEDQGNFGNFLAFQPTSDALYWVSNAAGTGIAYELRTTGLGGGTPSVVPAVAGASDGAVINGFATVSLFARGDTLYFNRDVDDSTINGVYRYQVGDTAPTQLVMAENVTSIMVDDTSIYLLQRNTSGVFKAPLTGGSAARIANLNALKFIGQDAQFLYLLTTTCCVSTLVKVLK
jgi:hypothetical protein